MVIIKWNHWTILQLIQLKLKNIRWNLDNKWWSYLEFISFNEGVAKSNNESEPESQTI